MTGHYCLCNGKPQPEGLLSVGRILSIKPFKDMGYVLFGYAFSCVCNCQNRISLFLNCIDVYAAPFAGIFMALSISIAMSCRISSSIISIFMVQVSLFSRVMIYHYYTNDGLKY